MKEYESIYEDVVKLTEKERRVAASAKINFPKGTDYETIQRYADEHAHQNTNEIFLRFIKARWLNESFRKARQGRSQKPGLSISTRRVMYHEKVGHEMQHYMLYTPHWLSVYLNDWFPKILVSNPFTTPEDYEFPYKHVTLEFLFVVHMMHQKYELLQIAEDRKMTYMNFVNYVINHALCYNDDHNCKRYKVKTFGGGANIYIKRNY